MMNVDFPLLAAIRVGKDLLVDDLLELAARTLLGEGRIVAGFLQRESTGDGECCGRIELEDIASGDRNVISQALGSGARGCRLDPQALAGIAGPLLASLDKHPELLLLNRFGKGESEGQGFRAVIEAAYARGIPVLTAVRENYADAWKQFAGEIGTLLAPDRDSVIAWARRASAVAATLRQPA